MDINRVILCGRIGNKKEIRKTPNNHNVLSFSVATSKPSRNGGQDKITTWHNIVAWNKNALLVDSLEKGTVVFIEGELTSRSYDKKDGTKVYVTEVIANLIAFVPKESSQESPIDDDKESFNNFASSIPF